MKHGNACRLHSNHVVIASMHAAWTSESSCRYRFCSNASSDLIFGHTGGEEGAGGGLTERECSARRCLNIGYVSVYGNI